MAYYNRALAYEDKKELDYAISDYTKAIEINPEDYLSCNNRGKLYSQMGKHDQAIKDFDRAIKINPAFAKAYNNKGSHYSSKGQYDLAIEYYTIAIEIDPKYATAYYNRGFVNFVKLGNTSEGCTDWKMACELGQCRNYEIAKQQNLCP